MKGIWVVCARNVALGVFSSKQEALEYVEDCSEYCGVMRNDEHFVQIEAFLDDWTWFTITHVIPTKARRAVPA